jgi:hypothetical protein
VEGFRQCLYPIARLFGEWFPIRDSIKITFHADLCLGFLAMNTRDVR